MTTSEALRQSAAALRAQAEALEAHAAALEAPLEAPPADEPKALIRAEDVAARLGLSPKRIYALASEGRLPSVKIGRQVRFAPSAVEAFIEAGGEGL